MIIEELVAIFRTDYRGKGEARRFADDLEHAEKAAQGFADVMLHIGGVIGGALAGLAITDKIGDFIGDLTRTNAEFENYEATLKTITGSAEKAKQAMDWVADFAGSTPYDIAQVTEAFVKMKAYGLDPTDGSLRKVGDASSAMGKHLMDGVEAIADAITGESERLKEFGISTSVAGDKITYNWTQNGQKLSKTVKKDAVEIQGALMGIFSRFDGAMDDQSKTWDGMVSNLLDNWTRFQRAIGAAGYYDAIKKRLGNLLDWVGEQWKSGLLTDIARGISNGLVKAITVTEHIATQAYRMSRGFFLAADGVAALLGKMTGLGKTAELFGLSGAAVASSAFGRRAMLALARRVPALAAYLALDDLISAFNGDDSVIGELPGAQKAIANVKAAFEGMVNAADKFAAAWNNLFGYDKLAGETDFDAMARSFKGFASTETVRFINEMGDAIKDIATGITAVTTVLNDPAGAWTRFADAAIAQLDRIIRAVDEKLGGALTKFGIIPDPNEVALENNRPTETLGQSKRAIDKPVTYTPDARLEMAGRQQAEGISAEYGVDEESLTRAAARAVQVLGGLEAGIQAKIANLSIPSPLEVMKGLGDLAVTAKATLDLTEFLGPANQAKAAMADLAGTTTAKLRLDATEFNVGLDRAEARLARVRSGLASAAGSGSATDVGRSAVAPRALVTASPANR
ncbi:tape measure protein [Aureimonas leprariae]|uniref:Tape measure protein N-terminal domain-containing protein n=1 Tax=Plantimonas leprariae TaxID=2615207 RepID=A0A7V7PL70_9HYPH|nr:tape measure protein [Aureimonas leprariae]KAB0676714.1 hypothetical protein F6X38_20655 [Aureimonas leprariae]